MHPNRLTNGFREAVTTNGLFDVGIKVCKFIWEHGKGIDDQIQQRLDQALCNYNFKTYLQMARY